MNGIKHRQLFDDPELGFILLLIGTIIAFAELLLYRFFNVLFSIYIPRIGFFLGGDLQWGFIIFIVGVLKIIFTIPYNLIKSSQKIAATTYNKWIFIGFLLIFLIYIIAFLKLSTKIEV